VTPLVERVEGLRAPLLAWYAAHGRDFPWRRTRDPYAILVSEVMLQQTQASRVAERFPRFLARFPDARALAAAPTAAVLAEWSGLGYNRRPLALRQAAGTVVRDGWPRDVAALERLPGVGPYTARAVASLAFDIPVGVVDTNVRRWLLRRFGGPDAARRLQALADQLAAPGVAPQIAAWTHATMELGATVCRSRLPICADCPLAAGCPSRDRPAAIPVRRHALAGSDREYRGALLRALTASPDHRLTEDDARTRIGRALAPRRWTGILTGLERDRLIHRRGGSVRLGAATIDS